MAITQFISRAKEKQLRVLDITAATQATVPAGHALGICYQRERGGAAVTGGLKVGTTLGGSNITSGQAMAANGYNSFSPNALLPFAAGPTTLFIDAVTSWNGARVDLYFILYKLTP
jgi:hypothetical protein